MTVHKKIEEDLTGLWYSWEGTPPLPYVLKAVGKVVPKDAVVLDLDGLDRDETLSFLRSAHFAYPARKYDQQPDHLNRIADAIEAQTKPPRIPEPGWGALVEAGVTQHDERLHWQRNNNNWTATRWSCSNPNEYDRMWDELIDPVLIREGV